MATPFPYQHPNNRFYHHAKTGWFLSALLATYLILSLVACSSNATPPPTTQSSHTPAPTPAQVTKSVNFEGDKLPSGWKNKGEYLESDLSEEISLTIATIEPNVSSYSVEFQVQVVEVPKGGGFFMLTADPQHGKDGYQARILNLLKTDAEHGNNIHAQSEVSIDPEASNGQEMQIQDYEPTTDFRTYRVEVEGSRIQFFVDDRRVSMNSSTQTEQLSHGPIKLVTGKAILRVKGVRITTLT